MMCACGLGNIYEIFIEGSPLVCFPLLLVQDCTILSSWFLKLAFNLQLLLADGNISTSNLCVLLVEMCTCTIVRRPDS